MSKPAYRLRRTTQRKTQQYVGWFYEQLARSVMKASFSNNLSTEDLVMRRIMTGLEVKGCDNNNSFRVRALQLQAHAENVGEFPMPFDYFLYCCFCYRNKSKASQSGVPRRSLLARCKSEYGVYSVLSQYTDRLYIFDHRVMQAIQNTHGTKDGTFSNQRGDKIIEFRRRFLSQFTVSNQVNILSSLGLNPDDWMVRERTVRLNLSLGGLIKASYQLDLKVVEVLTPFLVPHLDTAIRLPVVRPISTRRMNVEPFMRLVAAG